MVNNLGVQINIGKVEEKNHEGRIHHEERKHHKERKHHDDRTT